jgi:2'-5' RNA ligase
MRLFIAIKVPQFQKLNDVYNEIKLSGADVKLVETDNIHITLIFIGEVPDNKVDLVKEAVSLLQFNKFKITMKGMGAFPSITKPRVVWVGISEGFPQLREIRSFLLKELRSRGIRPEDEKEFVPHITLGRVKGPSNLFNLANVINQHYNDYFGDFIVDKVILYKSTLTPKGPIYDEILGVAGK